MTYTFRRVATEPRINGNGEFINKIYLEVTYKSYGKDTQRFFVEDLIQPGPTSDPKKLPISDLSSGQIMSRAAGDSFRDIPVPGRGPEYSPSNTSDGSGIKGFIIGAINSALRNPITYVEALYKGLNIINDINGNIVHFITRKGTCTSTCRKARSMLVPLSGGTKLASIWRTVTFPLAHTSATTLAVLVTPLI